MSTGDKKISVIIPYAGERDVKQLLDMILQQLGEGDEIILACSGSIPRYIEPIKTDPRIRLVFEKEVKGAARNRNLGVIHSKNSILLFLDSDIIIYRDTINSIRRLDFSSKIIYLPIVESERTPIFPYEDTPYGIGPFTPAFCCSKKVFEEIGLFDERFKRAYREDTEFYYRAKKAGYKLIPFIKVFHPLRRNSLKGFLKYFKNASEEPKFHKAIQGNYLDALSIPYGFNKNPFKFAPNKHGFSILSFVFVLFVLLEIFLAITGIIIFVNLILIFILLSMLFFVKRGSIKDKPNRTELYFGYLLYSLLTMCGRIYGSIKFRHLTI
jgi:glycosyltransferase involved in cell wall biosynthesis